MKSFYGGLREVYEPVKRGTTQLTALDGTPVLREKSEILGRFAEHFDQLLNIPGALDVGAASAIHVRPSALSIKTSGLEGDDGCNRCY